MNKKENNANKSIKRMFLSLCMMTFVATMSVENTNGMDGKNSILGKAGTNKPKQEPIKEGVAPLLARKAYSNQSALPGSPIVDPENNTETKYPSHIMNSLKESDTKNDKNTILGTVEDNGVIEIPKMKFLGDPSEKERVTQIVQAIVERFNSESLGFFNTGSSMFFNDTPIQQFEDLCSIYDTDELVTLEDTKSLKSLIQQKVKVDSYPNTWSLLTILK